MEVLTLQTRVYYPDGSINITNTSILPRWKYSYYKHEYITQMEVLTLQTRILPRHVLYYKHEYITQMEVLTLQTRVYYPDGSINITNTSILPRWKYYITNTSILPRWKY